MTSVIVSRVGLFAGAGLLMCVPWLYSQEAIHEVRWSRERFAFPQLSAPALIEVLAVEFKSSCVKNLASAGFFFPYYLFIPKDISRSEPVRLLIEPNNTGQTTDDFEVHRASAKRLASAGNVRRLADRLHAPLLVPVFPRPRSFVHHQQIVWNKGRPVLTRTHYWFQHEPCWYVRKPNAPWFG